MTDSQTSLDSFGARGSLRVGGTEYEIYRLACGPRPAERCRTA